MNKKEIEKILVLHKKWLTGEDGGVRADLGRTDLSGANLSFASLDFANLSGADLNFANLSFADLSGANLSGAKLRNADLTGANLSGTDLSGANLDFSCLPLRCESLKAGMDDKQAIQLLYHTLSIVKNSTNVSKKLKNDLLTESNITIANKFHRVDECGKLSR